MVRASVKEHYDAILKLHGLVAGPLTADQRRMKKEIGALYKEWDGQWEGHGLALQGVRDFLKLGDTLIEKFEISPYESQGLHRAAYKEALEALREAKWAATTALSKQSSAKPAGSGLRFAIGYYEKAYQWLANHLCECYEDRDADLKELELRNRELFKSEAELAWDKVANCIWEGMHSLLKLIPEHKPKALDPSSKNYQEAEIKAWEKAIIESEVMQAHKQAVKKAYHEAALEFNADRHHGRWQAEALTPIIQKVQQFKNQYWDGLFHVDLALGLVKEQGSSSDEAMGGACREFRLRDFINIYLSSCNGSAGIWGSRYQKAKQGLLNFIPEHYKTELPESWEGLQRSIETGLTLHNVYTQKSITAKQRIEQRIETIKRKIRIRQETRELRRGNKVLERELAQLRAEAKRRGIDINDSDNVEPPRQSPIASAQLTFEASGNLQALEQRYGNDGITQRPWHPVPLHPRTCSASEMNHALREQSVVTENGRRQPQKGPGLDGQNQTTTSAILPN